MTDAPETPKTWELDTGLSNKRLIGDELWDRLVGGLIGEGMDRQLATRVTDQMLWFLRLKGANPDERYTPSELVAVAWHRFYDTYRYEYLVFRDRTTASEQANVGKPSRDEIRRTIAAMETHGIPVEEAVWQDPDAEHSTSSNR